MCAVKSITGSLKQYFEAFLYSCLVFLICKIWLVLCLFSVEHFFGATDQKVTDSQGHDDAVTTPGTNCMLGV